MYHGTLCQEEPLSVCVCVGHIDDHDDGADVRLNRTASTIANFPSKKMHNFFGQKLLIDLKE